MTDQDDDDTTELTEDPFEFDTPMVALGFSVSAMNAAADRVNRVAAEDLEGAFAAIGEAVWWVTVVSDTLRNRHPDAYARALELQTPRVEEVIDGLRSVRHRIGHEVDLVDYLRPVASRPDLGDGRITAWAWKSVRAPTRKHKRDLEGHRAYESAVAETNIVHTFTHALSFLRQVHSFTQNEPAPGKRRSTRESPSPIGQPDSN